MAVPPPPPPAWGTGPPSYGVPTPNAPGWGATTISPTIPPPRGTLTHRSVSTLHAALRLYLIVLVLTLLISVISAITVGITFGGLVSYFGSGELGSVATNNSAALRPFFSSGAALGFSFVVGIMGLLVLILTIVSWSQWRDSVRSLEGNSFELGGPYPSAASRVRADYSRTVTMFILQIVLSVVLGVVLVAIIVSAFFGSLAPGSSTALRGNFSHAIVLEIIEWAIAAALVGAVLNFLLYFFATRSHVNVLKPIASAEVIGRLERGRRFALVGAALSPVGILGLLSPYLALVGLLPPLLVVLGFYFIYTGVGSWLSRPLTELANLVPRPL